MCGGNESERHLEVPPCMEVLLLRGGTRPLFGSPAVTRHTAPDLWLCVPASRPVCLSRKKASKRRAARTVPPVIPANDTGLRPRNHQVEAPPAPHRANPSTSRRRHVNRLSVTLLTPRSDRHADPLGLAVRLLNGGAKSGVGAEHPPSLGAPDRIAIATPQVAALVRL